MAQTEKPKVEKKAQTITPTIQQIIAFNLLSDAILNKKATALNMGSILRQAGYSQETSETPKLVTESKGFKQLLDKYLPDDKLLRNHAELLDTRTIEHMVFPLNVSDEEITDLLNDNGCTPKKFMHGEQSTHVWFFMKDANALKNGLDMGYKLKGHYKQDQTDESAASKIGDFLDRAAKLLP